MADYKARIVDALLERKLKGKGAVLVEGAKWCGKTTTAMRKANSVLKLGDTGVLRSSRQLAEMNPSLLLKGDTPRLIDEWQTIPTLWDCVRSEVDERSELGWMPVSPGASGMQPRDPFRPWRGTLASGHKPR